MQTIKLIAATLGLSLLANLAPALAANVDARLSTREAYVGMPITLQITIANAEDYDQPKIPQIDGCDIRSAGSPSQSSQVTIINGRRSVSRSVIMQYLITPRREGTFQFPALAFRVDGRMVTTKAMRFAATKSVTGDLLFVEIEGGKDKVFVGQPLDLTLKIWIKPYRDAKRDLKLSEGDMWNMISNQTSWGGFAERLQELAKNNQRPGGQEVLRDDGQGNERSYYLYEIDATVYPKRPGKIDADDVQIVVNYPTSLGKSRSPFGSLFEDSPFGRDPFGGSSPLSRLMDDDFFRSSFGDRLAVTATRPIVGEVSVDETKVIPVPSAGRPADYRGAVGRYRIVTQANPTTVAAGDPITLNIGIAGDGPMELVQAPPLAQLSSLTTDFKVEDQALAGFVQDDTKLFSTSIRPRREGIAEIPAIAFSFFDPETETFETVKSDPIAITVNPAETLALDAIVGSVISEQQPAAAVLASRDLPDFTNNDSSSILVSQTPRTPLPWWSVFVVLPPVLWLATLVIRYRNAITSRMPNLRSAYQRCWTDIERATDRALIADALVRYIAARSGKACSSTSAAVGALRRAGMYAVAIEIELYLQESDRAGFGDVSSQTLIVYRERARELLQKLEASFKSAKQSRLRLAKGSAAKVSLPPAAQRTIVLFLATTFAFAASNGSASDNPTRLDAAVANLSLSRSQQETILQEAHEAYSRASRLTSTDSAEVKELFDVAAVKYQLLVDSGIRNSQLYLNLGNAYLRSGELGRAIANYQRARQLDPGNRQVLANLEFADEKVKRKTPTAGDATAQLTAFGSIMSQVRSVNQSLVRTVGLSSIIWFLVISSVVFWSLLIVRTAGYRFHVWRLAAVPLVVLLVSLGCFSLASSDASSSGDGVIVADSVQLHAGDGDQFATVATIDAAQGHQVDVLAVRGNWTQVRTAHGQIGWVPEKVVQRIRS